MHLIYDSEQDTKGLAQKYPDREALVEMYRDSFPLPVCDFKRAAASKSDFKRADASGTIATYGHCATKGLGTIFGFRGHLLTTVDGVPVDFVRAIASADIDDREVLRVLCDRGNRYPILLGDKGYISEVLQDELLDTEDTVLLPTLRSNPKDQYPESFRKRQVKLRRRVETTIGQLVDQFNVSDVRAH
ncbi:transposase [Candidatus Poribacteria bacterium]|nr:transposase [Candidatus Poribacteria bacterium]